jgi:DNA invertase Pin-like site-specific DNA recombinase
MVGIYCRTSKDVTDGSSIIQQKELGIKYCEKNGFEYQVYEDEGKSGYKLSDDEDDPFKDRPDFNRLMKDIDKKLIDKVWVFEHSRLARNTTAFAWIYAKFKTHNIIVVEKDKVFDLTDGSTKFMMDILNSVSEYERNMIVGRVTRGLHNAINTGRRAHGKLFGYKKNGRSDNKKVIWEPVKSDIEKLKYAYKRFLKGAGLRQIGLEIIERYGTTDKQKREFTTRLGWYLRHFEYTGNALNIEGLKILHAFHGFEIDSIRILESNEYWVKSQAYTEKIVSVKDWITCMERLQTNKAIRKTINENMKRSGKDLITGLIICSCCGLRYYAYLGKYRNATKNQETHYMYYKHHAALGGKHCPQIPKTIKPEDVNEIFRTFYFFFYIVFDNTKDLIKLSQEKNKAQQLEVRDKIKILEKEISRFEKQNKKFEDTIDQAQGVVDITILLKKIESNTATIVSKNDELTVEKKSLEELRKKFENDKINLAYYDTKERVLNWFYTMPIDQQRDELKKIIKACYIFNENIIIDTGSIIFLFNLSKDYTFNMELLDDLDKDRIYKSHFIDGTSHKKARSINNLLIPNVLLDRNRDTRLEVAKLLLNKYGVAYDMSEAANFIDFTHSRGFYTIATK